MQGVRVLVLPWMSVFYHKRGSGFDLIDLITHAIHEASFSMNIGMPAPAAAAPAAAAHCSSGGDCDISPGAANQDAHH